ncbi:MAG: DUF3106 domain-containing protein, partial [Bryobacteraceae bacterium]
LQQFSKLSPQERQRLRKQLEMFRQLPPERQNAVRKLWSNFQTFPPDRQQVVQKEYKKLSSMPEAKRAQQMNSEEFRNKYNPDERDFLSQMTGTPPK